MAGLNLGDLQVGVVVNTGTATKELSIFKDLLKKTEEVGQLAEKQFKSLGETINKIDFDKLSKKLDSFGNTMSTKVTLPLAAIGTASFKMAADLEQAVGKTDAVFANNSQTVKTWSQDAINNMGMAKVTALQMASGFGALGIALKVSDQQALEMGMTLTKLSSDLAAFYDTTLSESKTGLEGIFTGEMEALKKFGTVMSVANLEAFALAQGIQKSYKEMSEAEKVALRYNFVLDSTKVAQGTFAREIDTASVQLQVFKETLKEVGSVAGDTLLPIFTEVLVTLKDVLLAFSELDQETQETIVKMGLLAAAIGPLSKVLSGLSKSVTVVKGMGAAFGTAATSIGWSTGALGLFVVAVGTALGVITDIIGQFEKEKKILEEINEIKKDYKDTTYESLSEEEKILIEKAETYTKYQDEYQSLLDKQSQLAEMMNNEESLNGSGTDKWKAMRLEMDSLNTSISESSAKMRETDKALVEYGGTVATGVKRGKELGDVTRANSKAQEEATKIETEHNEAVEKGLVISEKGREYIADKAESYMNLVTQQKLSAEQLDELAATEKFLIDIFGQEVIIRDQMGNATALNINAMNDEKLTNTTLANAKIKAVNAMGDANETHVRNQVKATEAIIAALQKEIDAYGDRDRLSMNTAEWAMYQDKVNYKKRLEQDLSDIKFVPEIANMNTSYERDKDNYKKTETEKQKTFKELQKERIDAYEGEIEDKKYYNSLTLEQELQMYRTLMDIAKGNGEEQQRITKEIFRVKQDMLRQEVEEVQAACDAEIKARKDVLDQEVKKIDFGLSEELKELQGELDRLDYEAEQARVEIQKKEKQQAIDDAKKRLSMAVTEEERYKAAQDLKKKEIDYEQYQNELKLKEERRRIQEEMGLAREKAQQAKDEAQTQYDTDVKSYEGARDKKLEIMEKQYEEEFKKMTGKQTDFNVVETGITQDLNKQLAIRNELFRTSIQKDLTQLDLVKKAITSLGNPSSFIQGALKLPDTKSIPPISVVEQAYRGQVTNVNDQSRVNITNYVRDDKDMERVVATVKKSISGDIKTYSATKGGSRK